MTIIECSGEYITEHKKEFSDLYKITFLIHHPQKSYFPYSFFEEQIDKKIGYVRDGLGKVFAAEDCGNPVGWMHVYKKEFLDEKRLSIADIVVNAAYRRKGIGRMLFHAAENYASESGCNAIEVLSVNTEQAISFYHQLGFKDFRIDMVKEVADE